MSKDNIYIDSPITKEIIINSRITKEVIINSPITKEIFIHSPIGVESFGVVYSNGIVTNAIFGEVAIFDFDVKSNISSDFVFVIDWGAEIGTTNINVTLVSGVSQSLQTSILIPEGVNPSQTINVTDSLGGSYEVEYTVEAAGSPIPELNYWPFLGNTDDIIGGNDGINSGAVLTIDKGGSADSAYDFDAGDSMAATSPQNIGKVYSIAVRMKPELSAYMFLNQTTAYYNFFNSLVNFIHNVNGVNVQFTISPEITLNQYHDFVITRNGTSVEFFVDGVQQDTTKTLSANTDYIFTEIAKVGAFDYEGVLDDIRIYNRVITQDEIDDLHAVV